MTPEEEARVFITVDETRGQVQVNIGTEKHGFRLLGPKYDVTNTQLGQRQLNSRDAEEIYSYIKPLLVSQANPKEQPHE